MKVMAWVAFCLSRGSCPNYLWNWLKYPSIEEIEGASKSVTHKISVLVVHPCHTLPNHPNVIDKKTQILEYKRRKVVVYIIATKSLATHPLTALPFLGE